MAPPRKSLKFVVNGQPVIASLVFDTPIEREDTYRPGNMRYGYALRGENDSGVLKIGEEGIFWTSNPRVSQVMNGFQKGDTVKILYTQEPGQNFASYNIRPAGQDDFDPDEEDAEEAQHLGSRMNYPAAKTQAAPAAKTKEPAWKRLGLAIRDAYKGCQYGAKLLAEDGDADAASNAFAGTTEGETFQRIVVTLFLDSK